MWPHRNIYKGPQKHRKNHTCLRIDETGPFKRGAEQFNVWLREKHRLMES